VKKLFFVLLVLNLVFWLWGKRQELAPALAQVEPGVGVIRLLDESEIAARREQARAATVAQAEPVDAPSPAIEPAPPPTEPEGNAATERTSREDQQAPPVVDSLSARDSSDEDVARATAPMPADPTPGEPAAPPAEETTQTVPAPVETRVESAAAVAEGTPPVGDPVDVPIDATARPSQAEPPAEPEIRASAPLSGGAQPLAPEQPAAEETPAAVVASPAPADIALTEALSPLTPAGPPALESPAPVAVVSAPAATICESVGPFRDRATAQRYASSLRAPIEAAVLREEVTVKPARFWVLAPAGQGGDAGYRQSLATAGVQDAWRVSGGPLAGRLSLGVFQVEENARKQVAMLAARGVASELQAVREQERRWWVDYERPEGARTRAESGGTARVVERPCARVAAP
jgi:hypothetical protein